MRKHQPAGELLSSAPCRVPNKLASDVVAQKMADGRKDDERGISELSSEDEEKIPTMSSSTKSSMACHAASALLISASDKAGMAGIDRERINAILLRDSGNSAFMQRQKKMDENIDRKIEEMRRRLSDKDASSNKDWRQQMKRAIEPQLESYRGSRRRTSTCVVIDMDSFFISCHILDHPHLASIPAAVGGTSMISTSNYVARKYGVRAAMPGYLGSTLVNELSGGKEKLTFVRSDFELYKRKSSEVRSVLEEYDPNLNMYSLDEAYMDIGPYLETQLLNGRKGSSHEEIRKILTSQDASRPARQPIHEKFPLDFVHEAAKSLLNSIRQKVKDATGLTCSAGLASNFLLSKIASDFNKPNGQFFVGPSEGEIAAFVDPLPARKVSGIGRVMEKTLRGSCGVETVRDLYDRRAEVRFLFKPATARFLLRASIGYSEGRRCESNDEEDGDAEESLNRKGIGHERTFPPTSDWGAMCTRLEGIAMGLIQDLRERNLRPRTITLKVKLLDFNILSRATTRDVALFQDCNRRTSPRDLVDVVVNLLKEARREHVGGGGKTNASKSSPKGGPPTFAVRLLGVRCSNFQLEKDNQSSLDRYRASAGRRQIEADEEHHDFPQKSAPSSSRRGEGGSPMVINPYVRGNSPMKEAPIAKRALRLSPLPDRKLPNAAWPSETRGSFDHVENRITCPICGRQFRSAENGNAELNAHVDACLSESTVKELAKEETRCADERSRKKRRSLTDFFNSLT